MIIRHGALKKTIDWMENTEANVLYFCNAGKDRTGVVSAILLHRSGASRQEIVADYMKSKENLSDMLMTFARQNPKINIDVITPHERYITEFLDWYTKAEVYVKGGYEKEMEQNALLNEAREQI